jgi:nitrogen fixation protein NifB
MTAAEKSWRIAVASSNRLDINRHFGQAACFAVFALKADGKCEFIEERGFNQFCADCGQEDLAARIGIFADCAAVIAAKVGPAAKKELEKAGLLVFEQAGSIEENLRKLAKYLSRSDRPLITVKTD